jgi:hypothetical protein
VIGWMLTDVALPQPAQTSELRSADKLPNTVSVSIGIADADAAKPRDGDVVFEAFHRAVAGRFSVCTQRRPSRRKRKDVKGEPAGSPTCRSNAPCAPDLVPQSLCAAAGLGLHNAIHGHSP